MPSLTSRTTLVAALAATGVAGAIAGGVALTGTAGAATPTPTPGASGSTTARPSGAPSGAPMPGGPGRDGGPGRGGPGAEGVVTAVSSTALTVKDASGTSTTYVLNSSTTYHKGPKTTEKASAIAVGDRVHVRLTDATSSKTAADVDEVVPHLDGVVASVTAGSVVITDRDGFARTIVTSASTTYTKDGAASTAAAVVAGARVNASGPVDSNKTSLDASTIDVVTKAPTPPAGGPEGGPGGHGPGGMGRHGLPAAPTS